jgi:hypothetical protein
MKIGHEERSKNEKKNEKRGKQQLFGFIFIFIFFNGQLSIFYFFCCPAAGI